MTPEEFVTWLKGFAVAANSYNITPAQWDAVKEKLAQVHSDTPTLNYWEHTTSTATTLPPGATVNYTANTKTLLND